MTASSNGADGSSSGRRWDAPDSLGVATWARHMRLGAPAPHVPSIARRPHGSHVADRHLRFATTLLGRSRPVEVPTATGGMPMRRTLLRRRPVARWSGIGTRSTLFRGPVAADGTADVVVAAAQDVAAFDAVVGDGPGEAVASAPDESAAVAASGPADGPIAGGFARSIARRAAGAGLATSRAAGSSATSGIAPGARGGGVVARVAGADAARAVDDGTLSAIAAPLDVATRSMTFATTPLGVARADALRTSGRVRSAITPVARTASGSVSGGVGGAREPLAILRSAIDAGALRAGDRSDRSAAIGRDSAGVGAMGGRTPVVLARSRAANDPTTIGTAATPVARTSAAPALAVERMPAARSSLDGPSASGGAAQPVVVARASSIGPLPVVSPAKHVFPSTSGAAAESVPAAEAVPHSTLAAPRQPLVRTTSAFIGPSPSLAIARQSSAAAGSIATGVVAVRSQPSTAGRADGQVDRHGDSDRSATAHGMASAATAASVALGTQAMPVATPGDGPASSLRPPAAGSGIARAVGRRSIARSHPGSIASSSAEAGTTAPGGAVDRNVARQIARGSTARSGPPSEPATSPLPDVVARSPLPALDPPSSSPPIVAGGLIDIGPPAAIVPRPPGAALACSIERSVDDPRRPIDRMAAAASPSSTTAAGTDAAPLPLAVARHTSSESVDLSRSTEAGSVAEGGRAADAAAEHTSTFAASTPVTSAGTATTPSITTAAASAGALALTPIPGRPPSDGRPSLDLPMASPGSTAPTPGQRSRSAAIARKPLTARSPDASPLPGGVVATPPTVHANQPVVTRTTAPVAPPEAGVHRSPVLLDRSDDGLARAPAVVRESADATGIAATTLAVPPVVVARHPWSPTTDPTTGWRSTTSPPARTEGIGRRAQRHAGSSARLDAPTTVARRATQVAARRGEAPLSIERRSLAPWRRDAEVALPGDVHAPPAMNEAGAALSSSPLSSSPLSSFQSSLSLPAPTTSGRAPSPPALDGPGPVGGAASVFMPTAQPIVMRRAGPQRSATTQSPLTIGRAAVPLDIGAPASSTVPAMPLPAASVAGAAPDAPAVPDLDALVERTCSRLFETLAIEQERRGVLPWR